LHIHHYGHFIDLALPLQPDRLQVVYGPNEAGKSTLLAFLRDWLFDFPGQTPYDFKTGGEIAGTGTLTLADGRTVEMRRRKGNKEKVRVRINGRDTDIDSDGFQWLLGSANRGLFESVFAFGLAQLTAGEESLKDESLQAALYGGGLSNAASPERILKALASE